MPVGWHSTAWGYKVGTPDELTRAIARIGTLSLSRKYVWRGVPDHRYRMNSSLYRELLTKRNRARSELEMRTREIELLAQARQWRVGIELGELATDLQLVASLQHHELPTRLLDVTSNPMTALWFACQKATPDRDAMGVLFAIDATDMERVDSIEFALCGAGRWQGARRRGDGRRVGVGYLLFGRACAVRLGLRAWRWSARERTLAGHGCGSYLEVDVDDSLADVGLWRAIRPRHARRVHRCRMHENRDGSVGDE